MKLSTRQRKEADRVGGIELMIPWPPDLLPPRDLALDDERPAKPTEYAAALTMIAQGCEAADLVPVRVSAVRCAPPPSYSDQRTEYWLAVVIIGRRWVHARGAPEPRTMWAEPP